MQFLYPEIKPYQRHWLTVSDLHELYLEESGNPQGIPVLFVHGGPGAACDGSSRRFFNPDKYRIICFDQRGCGRSTPHAELKENTTHHLVGDMERIRELLGIERWLLFGGSWGSTLSLVYAETHPERVLAMVLRGIFLCRQQDLHWFYQQGASHIFPDYWRDYLEPIPLSDREEMITAYYHRLTGNDEIARMGAAKAWAQWEARCSTLKPRKELLDWFGNPQRALALARIEAHYFAHETFLEANQILRNIERLAGIPAILIHGRYDMVCPLDNAVALQSHWPDAELQIIREAGHAATEPGITDALIRATDEMARRLDHGTFPTG